MFLIYLSYIIQKVDKITQAFLNILLLLNLFISIFLFLLLFSFLILPLTCLFSVLMEWEKLEDFILSKMIYKLFLGIRFQNNFILFCIRLGFFYFKFLLFLINLIFIFKIIIILPSIYIFIK